MNLVKIMRSEGVRAVIAPTVHLNGSGESDLMEQYQNVLDGVQAALEAMSRATPHGRDYYVQSEAGTPESPLQRASNEHQARRKALQGVEDEIKAIMYKISYPEFIGLV